DRMSQNLFRSWNLLPQGDVFSSRAGWAKSNLAQPATARLGFTGPLSGLWSDIGQQQFYDRQEGTAVMLIDTTVSPPATKVYIIGGGVPGPATAPNPQSAEGDDLPTLVGAAWVRIADINFPRTNGHALATPCRCLTARFS